MFVNHSAVACEKKPFSFMIFSLKIVLSFLFKNASLKQ